MRNFFAAAVILTAGLVSPTFAQTDNAQQPITSPAAGLNLRTYSALGCFSDPGDMWDMGPYAFQTDGWCQPLCVRQSATYFALVNGTNCFCGNSPPDQSNAVSGSECDTTCNGFNTQDCGGTNRWAVFADNFRNGDSTGTIQITTPTQTWYGHAATVSTTMSTKTTSQTQEQSTVVVTAAAQSDDNAPSPGPNKTAIGVGVAAGLVAIAAIAGGIAFFVRQRKRRELEEERQRHEAVMAIVNKGGEKSPRSFGSDERLEPSVMFQRRQSEASIMDNQDYTRRILKVTNPDDR